MLLLPPSSPSYTHTRTHAQQTIKKRYRWRDAADAARDGGPEIVATQVVSDFLTPMDGDAAFFAARGRAVATYTYRLAFYRVAAAEEGAAAAPAAAVAAAVAAAAAAL